MLLLRDRCAALGAWRFPSRPPVLRLPRSLLPQIRIIQSQLWFHRICGGVGWLLNDAQKHCALL